MKVERKETAQTLFIDAIKKGKKDHAIEFAQWIRINRFKPLINVWVSPYYGGKSHTEAEMYELFVKSKE